MWHLSMHTVLMWHLKCEISSPWTSYTDTFFFFFANHLCFDNKAFIDCNCNREQHSYQIWECRCIFCSAQWVSVGSISSSICYVMAIRAARKIVWRSHLHKSLFSGIKASLVIPSFYSLIFLAKGKKKSCKSCSAVRHALQMVLLITRPCTYWSTLCALEAFLSPS